jgi:transposase-like protein
MVGFTGKLASYLIIRKCPYCHSSDVRRSHRKNLIEVAVSFAGIYPFRCESCNRRFRKTGGRLLAVISLVMKLVGWEG